ncbi:spermatogenesis-associated protein 6-like isoform X2 [Clytia hemisphaerica]|uniref:Spermatogenesis-associated protein 6 N-terminal domain-containing protein n=1 Tax=Clytia hemisphaerica TaxID=252671 RepID=A0A7M5VHE8_9CNID
MPRKAMKCIVEVDLHVTTCPGTFLRDYEYVYLHMEMLGLEARTKSVPPTFPLFFHERLKFERTFYDCTDPALVAAVLKGEDLIIELRQHTDYISDGKVISHCSSNTHDFLYPAIPPYYGSGREILLYKTAKFKPIRVTGEPVKLEFSTKTVIKEVPDFETSPRRSVSPSRSMRRSVSPSRPRNFNGNTTVESIPATVYRSSSPARHYRSVTEPTYLSSTTPRNLTTRLDDLDLSLASTKRRVHTVTPNMNHALRSSQRIQRRVDELVRRRDFNYVDSDAESDYSLDLLRESLRDERNALNDAIKEADREAFYRSLNRTR